MNSNFDFPQSTAKPIQHIAVYLTPDPSCRQALDIAREEVIKNSSEFFAFYIQTPQMKSVSFQEQQALMDMVNYASSIGAHIQILNGSDPVYLIGEYCRNNRIDLLVLNREPNPRGLARLHFTFAQRVSRVIPETRLLTVPGNMTIHFSHLPQEKTTSKEKARSLLDVLLILGLTTAVCLLLDNFGISEFILAQIYIIGVLFCSVTVTGWKWATISALTADLLFVFLFAEPRYTILYSSQTLTTAILMAFIVASVGAWIGTRLQSESSRATRMSWGTQMLLDTNHLLQRAQNPDEIIQATGRQLAEVSECDVVLYPAVDGALGQPVYFDKDPALPSDHTQAQKELSLAKDALHKDCLTGSLTQHHPEAAFIYFPWETAEDIYGVIGIRLDNGTAEALELMILTSIVSESAQAMEMRFKEIELQETRVQAEGDLLRSNLLKALSHDIRTPLTSIIGNVSNYQLSFDSLDRAEKERIWDAIKTDSLNMYYMVENLLTAARLDSSSMPIKAQPEILSDVIQVGLDFPMKANKTHPLEVDESDDLLMINMDPQLIAQVISNLVLNSIHHTPDGTPIRVRTYEDNGKAIVEVSDEGQGIKDSMKERIFDIFYTGEAPAFDSTHYLGLGLFLCKTIVDAHHGTIEVHDNEPRGCVFSFSLPLMVLSA